MTQGACTGIDLLLAGASLLGIELTPRQQRQLVQYGDLLVSANERVNLTGVRDPVGIMTTLFLDSLTIRLVAPSLRTQHGLMVDVGSGAGVPGLPLKIAYPDWELLAIESIGKKARFIAETAQALELDGVTVLPERAETAARQPLWRDRADLVTARAVAPLSTLIELCAPFARPGGHIVFPKSGSIEGEIEQARAAARALRLEPRETVALPEALPLPAGRVLVSYRKVAATPARFPRRVGLARTAPIT